MGNVSFLFKMSNRFVSWFVFLSGMGGEDHCLKKKSREQTQNSAADHHNHRRAADTYNLESQLLPTEGRRQPLPATTWRSYGRGGRDPSSSWRDEDAQP